MQSKKICFASNNVNKIQEIRMKLEPIGYEVLSLKDLGDDIDIPETGATLKENALLKAQYVYQKFGFNCFSDDTGLEVDALGGAPGVYSARYSGEEKSAEKNMDKLLSELRDSVNRKARFITVIALILDGKEYLFEGVVDGEIIREKRGNEGFGYDPIFEPEGRGLTFAEMTLQEKQSLSHRSRALDKMIHFLKTAE